LAQGKESRSARTYLPFSVTRLFFPSLALARQPVFIESGGIYLLSVDTGASRELTSPQPDSDDRPSFSPDGRWIAFTRGRTMRDVWIMPAQGGAAKQLTFNEKAVIGLT
jgi:Tol biopolymer transport system component